MNASAMVTSLEGLVGSPRGIFSRATATDSKPRQSVTLWLELMKVVLRSRDLRDATDWEIAADASLVNAASSLDASGGTVYGVLIDSIMDIGSDEEGYVQLSDLTGTLSAVSLDIGAFSNGPNAGFLGVKLTPIASTTAPGYTTVIIPEGLVFANGIFGCADGDEGNPPTASDVRIWVVYRQDTEVRAA